jgi:N-acetylmuramoyl-L-alanine amidase
MLALFSDTVSKATKLQKSTQQASGKHDKIIVAIDAGHGGDDPGAHGAQGTEEKNVVFAIATKLAKLINAQPDMKALMVRKGDYYVGLRKRMDIARAAKADLFISIHADAFQDATVRGSSVYVLSRSGASSEAALWLAKSENASDSIGGVSLEDKEDVLASVLLDLSQSATEEASVNVAQSVLKNCHAVGEMHKDEVQKAGFMVLKSPDIPSILVETAFISNPSEEENLLNTEYQTKMAAAIFGGVRDYFKLTTPSDTKVATL